MRRPVLIVLLALCGVLATYPTVVWSFAAAFDGIGDQWRLVLGHSWFTVPLALAIAAVVLSVHGMLVNAAFQEEAVEEFNEYRERELAALTAGAPAGSDTAPSSGAAVATVSAQPDAAASRERQGPRKRASTANRMKGRAKSLARRQIRRRTGF